MDAHGGPGLSISEQQNMCFDLNLYDVLIVLLLENQPTKPTNQQYKHG